MNTYNEFSFPLLGENSKQTKAPKIVAGKEVLSVGFEMVEPLSLSWSWSPLFFGTLLEA